MSQSLPSAPKRAYRIATRLEDKKVRCNTRTIEKGKGQADLRAHEYLIGYFTRGEPGTEDPSMRPAWGSDSVRMLFFVVFARKRKRKQVQECMAVIKGGNFTLAERIEQETAHILRSPRDLDHILEWASAILALEGFNGYNHSSRIEGDTKLQYI